MTDLFQQPDQPAIDESKDYLSELVGEGKKFKDAQALAKSKAFADQAIEIQNKKFDELRMDYIKLKDEYQARESLAEFVTKLQTTQPAANTHTPVTEEVKPFDPKQIESMFDSRFQEHETRKRHEQNFNLVQTKLKERFGNDYQKHLMEQTQSLGMSKEVVNDMAKNTPEALIRLVGADQKPSSNNTFQAPPGSGVRADSFKPSVEKRTWSWYQKLKESDHKKYLDPKTNTQMYKDAMALGDEFRDGDYDRFH